MRATALVISHDRWFLIDRHHIIAFTGDSDVTFFEATLPSMKLTGSGWVTPNPRECSTRLFTADSPQPRQAAAPQARRRGFRRALSSGPSVLWPLAKDNGVLKAVLGSHADAPVHWLPDATRPSNPVHRRRSTHARARDHETNPVQPAASEVGTGLRNADATTTLANTS